MTKSIKYFVTLTTFLFSVSSWSTCSMPGKEIMQKQERLQSTKFETEEQEIVLLDLKSKQKEKRMLNRYSQKLAPNNTRSLISFTGPKQIRGAALLGWNETKTENQWLYLPAAKKLQRIASGSKKNYFMGTDFTYADLEGEKIQDNNYKCLKEETCNKSQMCFVIEATPVSKKIKKSTGYAKRQLYIDKERFVTYRVNFHNEKAKHFKTAEYLKWNKHGKVWRPALAVMDRFQEHKTYIRVKKRHINKEIDPITFTKRYLQKEMHIK